MCLHTIIVDPENPDRIVVAISAAGRVPQRRRRRDLAADQPGPALREIPDPDAEVGHCVHHIAMHPSRPDVLFMQKHWDVMRSDDAGDSWTEVSGNLPTDFGFPIDVHAHEPDTVYVGADHERLGALPARRASCASIAAAPAGTSGSR